MPDGLPEYLLIIGCLFGAMLVGLVIGALLCAASDDDHCTGLVIEDLADGTIHAYPVAAWAGVNPGPYSGPWPCPNLTPCPIHERTR